MRGTTPWVRAKKNERQKERERCGAQVLNSLERCKMAPKPKSEAPLPGCIKLIQHRGGPARSKLNVNLKHFVQPAWLPRLPRLARLPARIPSSPAFERTISTFTTDDDERVVPNSNPSSSPSSKQMCATQQTCKKGSNRLQLRKKKKQKYLQMQRNCKLCADLFTDSQKALGSALAGWWSRVDIIDDMLSHDRAKPIKAYLMPDSNRL